MSALSDALNAANVEGWSAREISYKSGGELSHSVVADYLNGRQAKRPTEKVLAGFVKVFPTLSVKRLRELAGYPPGEEEPYKVPDEAHRLDSRQREAVTEIIMLLAEKNGGGGHADGSAAIRTAESGLPNQPDTALAALTETAAESVRREEEAGTQPGEADRE